MKFRRMSDPYWSVPLEELAPSLKLMLNLQWREFIAQIDCNGALSFDPEEDAQRDFLDACWEAA